MFATVVLFYLTGYFDQVFIFRITVFERHSSILLRFVVETLCISLPDVYVEKMIVILARALEQSPHMEYLLRWLRALLFQRGLLLQKRAKEPQNALIGPLTHLQKILSLRSEQLSQVYVVAVHNSFKYSSVFKYFNTKYLLV